MALFESGLGSLMAAFGFRPPVSSAPPMGATTTGTTGAVAVRLGRRTVTGVQILPDPCRQAPIDPRAAVGQFIEIIVEAIGRGDLPQTVRFSCLWQWYDRISATYGWPTLSIKTLSMTLNATPGVKRRVDDRRRRGQGRVTVFDFKQAMRRAAARPTGQMRRLRP